MEDGKNVHNPVIQIRGLTRRFRATVALSDVSLTVASRVSIRVYGSCDRGVVFYTIHGGGHTWPGGSRLPAWFAGETNMQINASELMWQFFRRQTLRMQ